MDVGVVRWGPAHGGGPSSSLQNSLLPDDLNPVNHLIQLSDMTQNKLGLTLPRTQSGLDQTAPDGVTNQTCGFMDIQLLHESRSVGFGSLHADPELDSDVLGGFSFTN